MEEQFLIEFLSEADELIETLLDDINLLRERRSEGRTRRELIARIYRRVHTIKGTASSADLLVASQIAHEMETVLDRVRFGRVAPNDTVLDAIEDGAIAIAASLGAAERGENAVQNVEVVDSLRMIASKAEGGESCNPANALAGLPPEIVSALSSYEAQRLSEALDDGERLLDVDVSFDLAIFDEAFRRFSAALIEDGEIISTLPGAEPSRPDQINFRIIYATHDKPEDLSLRLTSFGAVTIGQIAEGGPKNQDEARIVLENGKESQEQPRTLRVEVSSLDEIVYSAHELLREMTLALDEALSTEMAAEQRVQMEVRAKGLRAGFLELEERLIGLRMVTVGQVLDRTARAARVAARKRRKKVHLEVLGGDVRLDKSLEQSIADPLLHIVRNAIDHGIETPEERVALGKDEHGLVRLEASADGTRILLRISDDGCGIDPERVARAAMERGIMGVGATLSDEQSLRLIFRPGFSTSPAVSDLSGRGIGLDVVEKSVELAGGQIRVSSQPGKGACFELSLPMPLAIVPAVVVESGGRHYCIDSRYVLEMDGADVPRDAKTLEWHGESLTVLRLSELLGQSIGEEKDLNERQAIIANVDESADHHSANRAAIIVDRIAGRHEVLVRGLGRHGARWHGIAGATELRDGGLALMLELPNLLENDPG
jgi:two-component system chemotaxis sensor kinase CheA